MKKVIPLPITSLLTHSHSTQLFPFYKTNHHHSYHYHSKFPTPHNKPNHVQKMESLITEFTYLSDQSLYDKNFDPSTIENLMKLFEIESYKAWANLELEGETEVNKAESEMEEAEYYLDSVMDSAMAEFRRFEEEMNRTCKEEHDSLVTVAENARKLGTNLEKAATFASKKYIEAAMNSATASMKSAVKSIASRKVHPS